VAGVCPSRAGSRAERAAATTSDDPGGQYNYPELQMSTKRVEFWRVGELGIGWRMNYRNPSQRQNTPRMSGLGLPWFKDRLVRVYFRCLARRVQIREPRGILFPVSFHFATTSPTVS
jgi:hypothetical protein